MPPLSLKVIEKIVVNYSLQTDEGDSQYAQVEAFADELGREVGKIVSRLGKKHIITMRAKSPESLRGKLIKLREGLTMSPMADDDSAFDLLDEQGRHGIKDWVGVRVITYLEDDVRPIWQDISNRLSNSGATIDAKEINGPTGYRAMHIHGVPPSSSARHRAPFEVQVCSMAAHLWNELEHDISYKQPNGEPDDAQKELLLSLRSELDLVATTAKRLMQRTDTLIATSSTSLTSAAELRRLLEGRFRRPLTGDFASLFTLLQAIMMSGDAPSKVTIDKLITFGRKQTDVDQLMKTHDLDQNYGDVGAIALQMLSREKEQSAILFLDTTEDPPQLFKFLRRVLKAVHRGDGA